MKPSVLDTWSSTEGFILEGSILKISWRRLMTWRGLSKNKLIKINKNNEDLFLKY
jgi:hypothetical protein